MGTLVTSTDIVVTANDGLATLGRSVPHYGEKWAAPRATQRVEGVGAIAADIDVKLTGVDKPSTTVIAESVER